MKTVLKGKQRLSNLSNPTVNLQSKEILFHCNSNTLCYNKFRSF